MMPLNIQNLLFGLQDREYASFQSKLTPGIDFDRFIGVRVPEARKLAKSIYKNENYRAFLEDLPHRYYDEDMLHGLIISEIRDFDTCMEYTEGFLPYIDNWAVCDIMSPKVFKTNKEPLLNKIREWAGSGHTYTCRFGLEMLMSHFLDDDFNPDYLRIPAAVKSDEYYVNMMIAWFFATALAKQWKASLPYIKDHILDLWVHNKTIQKACESRRITPEQKNELKTYKRKF